MKFCRKIGNPKAAAVLTRQGAQAHACHNFNMNLVSWFVEPTICVQTDVPFILTQTCRSRNVWLIRNTAALGMRYQCYKSFIRRVLRLELHSSESVCSCGGSARKDNVELSTYSEVSYVVSLH